MLCTFTKDLAKVVSCKSRLLVVVRMTENMIEGSGVNRVQSRLLSKASERPYSERSITVYSR